jgi:hypothetical protein
MIRIFTLRSVRVEAFQFYVHYRISSVSIMTASRLFEGIIPEFQTAFQDRLKRAEQQGWRLLILTTVYVQSGTTIGAILLTTAMSGVECDIRVWKSQAGKVYPRTSQCSVLNEQHETAYIALIRHG